MLLDGYTEEIIGWKVGPTLDKEYPIAALRMVFRRIEDIPADALKLIHHSDRGVQYASSLYVQLLKQNGIAISMTESGNPKDNPQAERVNNTIKNELLMGKVFTSIHQVIDTVGLAVRFYNEERPHMSIDMMTPNQASQCSGEIRKLWISYRERHIKENQRLASHPIAMLQSLVAQASTLVGTGDSVPCR
jgi:transposase InsO family protein